MSIFNTDKRIRLGIWGLGRGRSFVDVCSSLNIDVVAGCDCNENLRKTFHEHCPDAFLTADENEFLARKDVDAVLVATYFFDHAKHCIMALEAGKHVMCEVTAFFTPADGVKLAEAVEKSGKIFNLLENYPFTKENFYMKKLYDEGFFGEFSYGEFNYVHECRLLAYACFDKNSPAPVFGVHAWRSYLNFQYYNTHSLGPVMKITGLRPEKITAFGAKPHLAGYAEGCEMNRPSPSLIKMSNGGIVRNLMGAMTHDAHDTKYFYGTRAAASFSGYDVDTDESHYLGTGDCKQNLTLYLGASGKSVPREVQPEWTEFKEYADKATHWGSDFWELYYFAREVFTGEKSPWDIYSACDVTLAGIMAVRSEEQDGIPQDIPDFRDPIQREKYRNDYGCQQPPFNAANLFGENPNPETAGQFAKVMSEFYKNADFIRKAYDGMKIYENLASGNDKFEVCCDVRRLIELIPDFRTLFGKMRQILAEYPCSPAAEALRSTLDDYDCGRIMNPAAVSELEEWLKNAQHLPDITAQFEK